MRFTWLVLATLLAAVVLAAPAQAAQRTDFQFDTGPEYGAMSTPYPHLYATTGARPGVATISVSDSDGWWGATVRWLSLGTGVTGTVHIPAWPAIVPTPPKPQQHFEIRPGSGPVVAVVEGGLVPGFGTFYVP